MRFQTGGLMCKQKPFRSPTEGSFFLPSKNPDQVDCLQLGCRSRSKLFKGHKNPWAQLLFLEEKPRWQMLLCTPPNMCQREQTCPRVVYNAGEEEVSWVGCIKYIFMYTLLWSSLWGYLSTSQTLRKGGHFPECRHLVILRLWGTCLASSCHLRNTWVYQFLIITWQACCIPELFQTALGPYILAPKSHPKDSILAFYSYFKDGGTKVECYFGQRLQEHPLVRGEAMSGRPNLAC